MYFAFWLEVHAHTLCSQSESRQTPLWERIDYNLLWLNFAFSEHCLSLIFIVSILLYLLNKQNKMKKQQGRDSKQSAHEENPPSSERPRLKEEKLSISYLFSQNGKSLCHLFGYHLSQKFDVKSIVQLGREIQQILVNEEGLKNIIRRVWPEIEKYLNIIPLLFAIFKDLGVVSLRQFNEYIQICKQSINPFMAHWKDTIPNTKIQKFIIALEKLSEKQDLRGTGLIDKLMVEDLCKKQLNLTQIKWDRELVAGDQFKYQLFLSEKYLRAGIQVDRFLLKFLINKIKKVLKKVAQKKKGRKKKTGRKEEPPKTKAAQKSAIEARKEKIVKTYIENNKPQATQNVNKIKFIVKNILQDVIFNAVEAKEFQIANEKKIHEKISKPIYTTDPQLPEIQYESSDPPACGKVRFINKTNIGIFVQENTGNIIDGMSSKKVTTFNIHPSKAIKRSSIIDYELFGENLYLLRADGLIYTWCQGSETVKNYVQTPFKANEQVPWKEKTSYLTVKDGLLFVNCTHLPHSRFYIYSMNLEHVGIVELNPYQFGYDYRVVEESLYLFHHIIHSTQIDKVIHDYTEYQKLLYISFEKTNERIGEPFQLGKMLTKRYKESLTIKKLGQYVKWILSYRINNTVILPKKLFSNIEYQALTEDDVKYLKQHYYISQESDLPSFKNKTIMKTVENRKAHILTLVEDCNLSNLNSPFLTRQEISEWLAPSCLLPNQLNAVFQSLQYSSNGKIDLSNITKNEHYQKIRDVRSENYRPEKYKLLQMPSVCAGLFLPQPILDYMVLTTHFPLNPFIYVVSIVSGNLINKIDMSEYTHGKPKIFSSPQNDYIIGNGMGNLLLWKPKKIKHSGKPERVWRNIEGEEIIDVLMIYELDVLLTLTKGFLKIWDFSTLLDIKESQVVFEVKPGYKAVDKYIKTNKQCKKKLFLRGDQVALFYCRTKNDLIIPGILSQNKADTILRLFSLNKFSVVVKKDKFHEAVPLKLIRELQVMANKRRHNKNRANVQIDYTTQENNLLVFIEKWMKEKQNKKQVKSLVSSTKEQFQRKINFLITDYYNIFNRNLFNTIPKTKNQRFQIFFHLFMAENQTEVSQLLNPNLLQLYKNGNNEIEWEKILEDALDYNERKTVNRILYLLSLVEKYTRPLEGCNFIKLLSKDRHHVDFDLVLQLLSTPLPLDQRIIEKSLRLLNSFKQPIKITEKLIRKHIPTRYRFLAPTYYKQILSPRLSIELEEYLGNRYEQEPKHSQILNKIKGDKKHPNILTHLNEENLLPMVMNEVCKVFPEVLTCNYTLTEALQCYRAITQDEAIYYCIMQSQIPGQRLSSINNQQGPKYNINQIMEVICSNLKLIKKVPSPKIQFTYFEENLYSGEHMEDVFYSYFKGIRSTHSILTDNFNASCDLFDMGLSLHYDQTTWFKVFGSLAELLQPLEKQFRERFPPNFRIVSVSDFKTVVMSYFEEEETYESITTRCAYACTHNKEKLQKYLESGAIQRDGMWVNVNYLFRFLGNYTSVTAAEVNLQSSRKNEESDIELPAFRILQAMLGTHHYMTPQMLMTLLQYNVSSLNLLQCAEEQQKYFKLNPNFCSSSDMKELLKINETILGLIMLNKFNRMDFEYRLTIVDYEVSTKQIMDILGGPMLMDLIFPSSKAEFMDYNVAMTKIKNHMLKPAMEILMHNLAYNLPKEIIELLKFQSKKTGRMPVSSVVKLILDDPQYSGLMSCIVRCAGGESDNAQSIEIESFLRSLEPYQNKDYEQYNKLVEKKFQSQNVIEVFLKYAQNQQICNANYPSISNYVICQEHMAKILQNENPQWLITYKPTANITQFVHHVKGVQNFSLQEVIQKFVDQCVCKFSIEGIIQLFEGEDISFAQFFNKVRNSSKAMSSCSAKELLQLYNFIKSHSSENKLTKQGYYQAFQEYISLEQKIEWISAYYDKKYLDEKNKENPDDLLEIQKNIYLLKNLYLKKSEQETIISTLNYERYLIQKHLNSDPIKIGQLLKIIEATDEDEEKEKEKEKGSPKKRGKKQPKKKKDLKYSEFKDMMGLFGVTSDPHLEQIYAYLKNNLLEIKERVKAKANQTAEDYSIEETNRYISTIRQKVKQGLININACIEDTQIKSSKLYGSFVQTKSVDNMGTYYPTYHAFLSFCNKNLVHQYKSKVYRSEITKKFNEFLLRNNLTSEKVYEFLGLSKLQNMNSKFTLCIEPHSIPKLAVETFAKYDQIGLQIKYPISLKKFNELIKVPSQINDFSETDYEQLFRQMDIFGIGYVNLNEVKRFKGSQEPYVHILSYLNHKYSNHTKWTYQPPPPKSEQIEKKLLKREKDIDKFKTIEKKQCLAIFAQYVGEDYLYFISNEFKIQNKEGFLNLAQMINWLNSNTNQSIEQANKFNEFKDLVADVQKAGNITAFLKTIPEKELKQLKDKIYQILPQTLIVFLLQVQQANPQFEMISTAVQSFYHHVMRWNTPNNHFYSFIKNMAQTQYTLIKKFYYSHSYLSTYRAYEKVSRGQRLTFFSLWKHIEREGIVGYGRQDIQTIFNIIDVNGDKDVQFEEFVKFWMACEQIFGKNKKQQSPLPIARIQKQISELTLQLVKDHLKVGEERIGVRQLGEMLNVKNEQKLRQIITLMNETNVNPNNGISRSKLRILSERQDDKVELSKNEENLLILGSKQELSEYLGMDIDKFKKVIMTKYPTFGFRIIQHLYDQTKFRREQLTNLYAKLKGENVKDQMVKSSENEKCRKLVNKISEVHRKYSFKKIQIKQFGESIAESLSNEAIYQDLKQLKQEFEEIRTFIKKDQEPTTILTYSLQNTIQISTSTQVHDPAHIDPNTELGVKIEEDKIDKKLYQIKESRFSKADLVQIQWLDTDYHCKSENNINLIQNSAIYNDREVSALQLDPNSNRWKLVGIIHKNTETIYSKFTSMNLQKSLSPKQIMRFVQKICEKLYHCHHKYNVAGLLLDLSNILVNQFNHYDIKFHNFVNIFSLDENRNYCDGVNSIDVVERGTDVAPQIWDQIYTQALDVYVLGVIMFYMMNKKIPERKKSYEGVEEQVWNYYSEIQRESKEKLTKMNEMDEDELTLWNLIYQCSKFEWYERPKLYQIIQTFRIALGEEDVGSSIIFTTPTRQERTLQQFQNGNLEEVHLSLRKNQKWQMKNLIKYRQFLTKYEEGDLYEAFNRLLLTYLQDIDDQNPEVMKTYMQNLVDYLFTPPSKKKSLCLLATSAYKNSLSHISVQKYLEWCDESWKISEFDIGNKLQQLNMENRIVTLHKNSSYFHDLTTLAQCRTTLEEIDNKKSNTGKKVAISFIQSALISNNVNKVYAIYRSGVIPKLAAYISQEQFQSVILKILQLITESYNPTKHINGNRTVDEVYKVMMVIYNIMDDGSPKKKHQKQSVITMLDYLNNYYNTGGQECKKYVLKMICKQQICTLPFLACLFNQGKDMKGDESSILLNLSYEEEYYNMLKSPTVNGYAKLKKSILYEQIKQSFSCYKETTTLKQLSTMPLDRQTYADLIHKHLIFYYYYRYKWKKIAEKGQSIPINYQNNFYSYFTSFILETHEICLKQAPTVQTNAKSLEIVSQIMRLHLVLFDFWVHPPTTTENIRRIYGFVVKMLQQMEDDQHLYSQNKANKQIIPDILQILVKLCCQGENTEKYQYDIMNILLDHGYIHFYCRVVKKQHLLLLKFIEKNVQKIHLLNIYPFEAEFRLTTFYYLLKQKQKHHTRIYQLLINSNFTKYLINQMLTSSQTMDLRFYKANTDIVPYRYCNPLRAEAITIIGFIFSQGNSPLADDIVSRMIPLLNTQYAILQKCEWSSSQEKMRFVQVLWFFANLTQCEDERLKYEFVNLGIHEALARLVGRYPMLSTFFPKMSETIRSGTILTSTFALSRSMMIR